MSEEALPIVEYRSTMLVYPSMETTTDPEAYCAEMNCDWQGEVPAIAKCPKCGSNQIRRAEVEFLEHPEFGTIPVLRTARGVLVCKDFRNEAAAAGITVPAVLE